MADGNISQIKLPDGKTYNVKDATISLDSIYDQSKQKVTLIIGSLEDTSNVES